MQAINVNKLLEDPLAGFIVGPMDDGSYNTFLSAIQIRYSLITSDDVANFLVDFLCKQTNDYIEEHSEYLLNEFLYEYRLVKGTTVEFEDQVLKDWITKIISKYGDDAGIDFYNLVIKNRKARRARKHRNMPKI